MNEKLTVGSCFSGIGGLELGLEWTGGFETRWQIEIESDARSVLRKHWPAAYRYHDISQANDDGHFERVDIVVGGFPCQDISDAGVRAGITGARSGLWRELYRTICLVRPRLALVENVAALLRRGMGTVLGDLAASGYDAEWDCIPACAVGARHIRERLFIVATTGPLDNSDSILTRDILGFAGPQGWWTENPPKRPRFGWGTWAREPGVARVAYGVPNRIHRLEQLGNAVVPQVAQRIGEMILAYEASK